MGRQEERVAGGRGKMNSLPLQCWRCRHDCKTCEHWPKADKALGELSPFRYEDSVKDGVRTRFKVVNGNKQAMMEEMKEKHAIDRQEGM